MRQRGPGAPFSVRFTWDGEAHEPSTGTSDRSLAAIEAARIYAAAISKPTKRRIANAGELPLDDLLAAWLTAIKSTHAVGTLVTYRMYAETHWLPFFSATRNLNDAHCVAYMRQRLGKVLAGTVRLELAALRNFCGWCEVNGYVGPVEIPRIKKAMLGTPHPTPKRVAAPELTPAEIEAFLAALPLRGGRGGNGAFCRPRFVVQFATSLRPSTIDRLSCPENWSPGSDALTITRGTDKIRFARSVPLTAEAIEALTLACPTSGLIFGPARHRRIVHRAALASMPKWKAEIFAGAHLRSARITHTIEATGNLLGAQYMAGHKNLATTSRYARASERAAKDMLAAIESGRAAQNRRETTENNEGKHVGQ